MFKPRVVVVKDALEDKTEYPSTPEESKSSQGVVLVESTATSENSVGSSPSTPASSHGEKAAEVEKKVSELESDSGAEFILDSSKGTAKPVTVNAPPWLLRDSKRRPTVKEVADFSMLTEGQKDVAQEYRRQATREILPPERPVVPLTIEQEREKAKRVARELMDKREGDSIFSKLKKKLFG